MSVSNISGKSGDDFVGFTGGDYSYYTQGKGDFDGIVIDGLFPRSCIYAVKFTGNDQHRYGNVSVSNVSGVADHGAIFAQNDTDQDSVRMDLLSVSNVRVTSLDPAWANIFLRAIEVVRLDINNVFAMHANQMQVNVDTPTAVGSLSISNMHATLGQTVRLVNVSSGASVDDLVIDKSSTVLGSGGYLLVHDGVLRRATIRDTRVSGAGSSSKIVFQGGAATGLAALAYNNVDAYNVHSIFDQSSASANGSTALTITLSGGSYDQIVGQGINVRGVHNFAYNFAGPKIGALTNNFVNINASATGTHDVGGHQFGRAGQKVVQWSSGAGPLYINGASLGADIAHLARRVGDIMYNTNASASNGTDGACGVGIFASVGTTSGSFKKLGTAGGAGAQY